MTNDPDHPMVSLACTGRILMPLDLTPNRVAFDRLMRHGPAAKQVVSIRRGDAGPIAPTVRPPRRSNVDATLCEIEPGEHYELEITVGHPRAPGHFSDVLTLETGHDEVPEMYVMISGEVIPRVAISPSQLQFPPTRDRPVDRTLHLQWDDGIPAKILTMETTLPGATVTEQNRHGAQVIVISLPAGEEPPPGHHSMTFTTDDPDVPSETVRIYFDRPDRPRRSAKARSPHDVAPSSRRVTPLKTRHKAVDTPQRP